MKSGLFAFAVYCVAASVATAQDVPLFSDDLPNLGRRAEPQGQIYLTPTELPDISVSLDNSKKPVVAPEKKNVLPPSPVQEVKRSPVLLKQDNRLSVQTTDQMAEQLSSDVSRYRVEARQKKTDVAPPPPEPQMPELIEDLFGKIQDVHAFDVSGISLGMTPEEVLEEAAEHGYRVTKREYGIPLYQTSFYEENCRAAGVRRPEEIRSCIVDRARSDGVHYLSSLTLAKPATAEYMQVLFSTHVTDNVAYKIFYENKGDNSLNFTRRNFAKKVRRRDAFWNMMYETYGYPDDKDLLIWGDPQTAYMQAAMQGANYNAYIVLEDKTLTDGDYADAADRKETLRFRHTFTFAGDPSAED